MTPTDDSKRPKDPGERGILSNLPSTRPQRPSARRAAAKRATAKQPKRGETAKRPEPVPTKGRGSAPKPPPAPPVPPQGFETEDEIELGTPVHPPSRPEVAGALAELVGELAQTGIARGGRLLRDALGRLPGI
ncbi:MAG TPA: hypothetical protein VGL57_14665 [Solirubrobacteraceae bacterium]